MVKKYEVGFVCGAFDLIHPGYVLLFQESKEICNFLIVALHEDPSLERDNKRRPIHTVEERELILSSIKYINRIEVYKTEDELYYLLQRISPDVRIQGEDYKQKRFTGDDLGIPTYYCKREHTYSNTSLRKKIMVSS